AHISFYFPTLWKKDVDGGEKHIIDAVFQHLELNDNLNVEIHVYKFADRDEPRVEVELCCVAGR
ncbi:MAG TPA: RusA family crossover junction endodeoxyribonuclease, partial [Ktedonobacteraceae bacterium]